MFPGNIPLHKQYVNAKNFKAGYSDLSYFRDLFIPDSGRYE